LNILGIETSTQMCSAAVTVNERLLSEYRTNIKNIHASKLGAMITNTLQDAGMQSANLHCIAVAIGPGSFTGLRIGLSFAKGLCFAQNIPLVAVNTLEAMAYQVPLKMGNIIPILKSRAGEFLAATFKKENFATHADKKIAVFTHDTFSELMKSDGFFLSPSQGEIEKQFPQTAGRFIPEFFAHPAAATIAMLGYDKFKQQKIENTDIAEPLYFQDFVPGKPKDFKKIHDHN